MIIHGNVTNSSVLPELAEPPKLSGAEFLFLDQRAVLAAGVLDMPAAMEAVGVAFSLYEQGMCRQPHKVVLRNGDSADSEQYGRYNSLYAMIGDPPYAVGTKWIGSFPLNRDLGLPRASALLILNSPETGFPIAVMDGTIISAIRTGAVTALGARHLAPRNTKKIGIVGAGVQARAQILGLMTALPSVREIAVYNRTREHAEALADECRSRWNAPAVVADSIRSALDDADVALTLTTAVEPLIKAEYVKPGALTIQISGHECDFDVVSQCSKIVVDDWDVLKHRGIMTPAIMHAQGLLKDEAIHASLGQLLLGRKPGRENDFERIHFAHMGMGIADIALGYSVYRRARRDGLGQTLALWDEPLWA